MKIRNGFVSNSSSSSFCIYGTEVPSDIKRKEIQTKDTSLEVYNTDFGTFIGRDWSSIGGEETGNQFRAKVESEIEKVLGLKLACGTYEEAWYDG